MIMRGATVIIAEMHFEGDRCTHAIGERFLTHTRATSFKL